MTNLKNKIFPLLIAFSALSVSASAAFYSVSGLSKLFAGASLEVIIMASSLEIAKLVIASLLYQYWDTINKALRVYLTIAAGVLILITSAGIYGFLSAAYQETANKENIVTQQITALETKKALYEETRDNLLSDRKSNNELRGTLSKGSTTQYTDKNGNLVVRTNNSAIRNLESTAKENEKLASKLDVVNDSIFALETQILETRVNSEAASELGPLKYLSELTGVEMNYIINWLLLVIIFVFDPLAIALVIAANFAFAQLRSKEGYHMYNAGFLHEEEIDNPEYKEWEEATINDGLEDLPWEEEETEDEDLVEEPQIEVKMSGEPSLNFLDLDGDGVVEKEEIQQVLDQISNVGNSFTSAEQWKKDQLNNELDKLRNMILKKKDDDTTKNYW